VEFGGAGSIAGSHNLIPITSAGNAAYTLSSLFDASVRPAAALIDAKSIGMVISTATPDTTATEDPLNWTVGQMTTDFSNGPVGGKTNLAQWFWEATLGLVELSDFFEILPIPGFVGVERGAFTVQSEAFPITAWLPVDVLDFANTKHTSDAVINPGLVSIASDTQLAKGWSFNDDSHYYVNPIPEPTTLALLGLGLLGMGASLRKRKAV